MGKGKKRSLASRKREKNVDTAMLDHAFKHKPEDRLRAEPFKASWETAVPRKLRVLMQAAAGVAPPRSREDIPRPNSAVKNRVGGSVALATAGKNVVRGSGSSSRDHIISAQKGNELLSSHQQAASQELSSLKQAPQPDTIRQNSIKKFRKSGKVRFGETNERPPELVLKGKLATSKSRLA
mmetsp:Transcript_33255/g.54932  ORF Transcript_33255/g.54932 Transcript_33255/m.54932 type:complete len:181 (+) Transcript_33255:35-577(+)|eukprot:CAMPEP_0119333906 /NCGR_PEP_ID=MMETSP1333-20130426/86240_1 /TAXON_ID=418940 /ORGANISM="Scyphosphaera apsteinii, Strain RCC1455" /LENGTH=180 /DNA_ID=CAMNT_0007344085 /DNA_START=32 /DNA_END=574 /DNA_ORIENTATION=+